MSQSREVSVSDAEYGNEAVEKRAEIEELKKKRV
jgi:hypothetical protein